MQKSLFEADAPLEFPLRQGFLTLHPHWLAREQADQLFQVFKETLNWEQSQLRIHGRMVPIPRLNAWYGDPGCHYQYSGHQLTLNPWTAELAALRQRLSEEFNSQFNSVLANFYRDGKDSVAWHSDDEPELGRNPLIASLSLGVSRRFSLKHRFQKQEAPVNLALTHGSLLLMSGTTQSFWSHCLPKSSRIASGRINLTFRRIVDPRIDKQ